MVKQLIDYENLRKTVVKGLKEYLKCPVIRSNQNAEPPKYPYASYTIITPMSENKGTYGEYDDNKARKPVIQTWSITVQSDDNDESLNLANKAREWLDYAGTVFLNDNGVIVQSVTNVSNRDNIISIEYEYKNGFDCFFQCMDELVGIAETIDTIESVSVNDGGG